MIVYNFRVKFKAVITVYIIYLQLFKIISDVILFNVDCSVSNASAHTFNLLMVLEGHAYGDLENGVKSSRWGDTELYREMDEMMLMVIEKTVEMCPRGVKEAQEEVSHVEVNTSSEGKLTAYMNALGGKRPNKNERNKIDKCRRVNFKSQVKRARVRRETTQD